MLMKFSMLKKTKFKISYRVLLILISVCMVSIFIVYLGTEYYSSIEKYISEKLSPSIEATYIKR